MTYRTTLFILIALLASVPLTAQKQSGALKLIYNRPATIWEEALPLGNGQTGAMVFGRLKEEHIQLNDNTLWSGYPDPGNNPDAQKYLPLVRRAVNEGDYDLAAKYWEKMQGPYSARYLHMAYLTLGFPQVDTGAVTAYQRSLDLETAIAATTYRSGGVTYSREAFISHPDKAMVIRFTASKKKRISFNAALGSKLMYRTETTGDNTLVLKGKAPLHVANRESEPLQVVYGDWAGEGMNFEIRVRILQEGGSLERSDTTLQVRNADAVTLILTEATSFNGPERSAGLDGKDPSAIAAAQLVRAAAKPYAQLKSGHLRDYQPLFNRVTFGLDYADDRSAMPTDDRMLRLNNGGKDPQLVALYYQYGRYLLIACSRPGSPPANLQGMWNDHVQPPWGSNYTTNINTEMNYWPAETTNLSECHEPLLDFLKALAANGAETARINYGIDVGWCAHHNSDIWAKSSPPGGYQWDPRSQPRWACWPMSGAWFSTHLWEHYLFTGNDQYLREHAWPLMKGAAQFLLSWLVKGPDGYLVTNPATSPENVFTIDGKEYQISMATTMDMAITRQLFEQCIQAATILQTDQAFKEQLQDVCKKLYPYHIGRYGQLQEWFRDWDNPEDKHRHLSHLFGLHPGNQVSPLHTPDLAAAARQSLIHRGDVSTGWSMAWKINWWARLGDGDHALKILNDGLTYIGPKKTDGPGGGTYPNLFDAHPPFQIDGNFGGTAGITEMLVQSHLGEISLLPALPGAWPAGHARGLRTRGGFEVSVTWTGGKIQKATITATRDGNCRVRTQTPVKVLETTATPAAGSNTNPLMQAPAQPAYENNSNVPLMKLDRKEGYVIDFNAVKGKTYTLVEADK